MSDIIIEHRLHTPTTTTNECFSVAGVYVTAMSKTSAAVSSDGTIHTPRLATHANVQIGPSLSNRPTMRLTSASLRALSKELVRIADRLDTPLRPGVQYRMPTLLTERDGDTYYTGPLDFGKWFAEYPEGRYPSVTGPIEERDGAFLVELCDDEERNDVAEYGSGATEEEAWRFALGAMFGPIDDGYDEDSLLGMIAEYDAEHG